MCFKGSIGREPRHADWIRLPAPAGSEGSERAVAERRSLGDRLTGVARPLALLLVIYSIFFQISVVRGSSMAPGIQDGDRILVEPWSFLIGEVERGDVVVLRYPLDPRVDYIKRVVGLPGDIVSIGDGQVFVNGERLAEPYVAFHDGDDFRTTVVSDGHYFVLGDNRPRSADSREFGQVPADFLRGRVNVRLWPPTRAGWLD